MASYGPADVAAEGFLIDAMEEIFVAAVNGATKAASKQCIEIARVIENGLRPADRQRIHEDVGKKGQQSVLRSYEALIGRGKGGAAGYRTGGKYPRYAGGKLHDALANKKFYNATPDRLDFINVEWLNDKAKQWARLNFGAGSRGKGSQRFFPVQFGNLVVASLGLDEGPRPAFYIPTGYFWKDGQLQAPQNAKSNPGAEFYVLGTGPNKKRKLSNLRNAGPEANERGFVKKKVTRGITARNFLDTGIARVADELPRQYKNLVNEMFRQGQSGVRPAPVTIKATPRYRYGNRSTPRT